MMRRLVPCLAGALLLLFAEVAAAKFRIPPRAPVDRLLTNVGRELEKKPDDSHLLYLKGRLHAVAYAMGEAAEVYTTQRDAAKPQPELPNFRSAGQPTVTFTGEIDEKRLDHLAAGIRSLRRASSLAKAPASAEDYDERPILLLGLAWLLDDGSRFAASVGHPEGIAEDGLSDADRAATDALIAKLGDTDPAERGAAALALRKALPRGWSRLFAQRESQVAEIRAGVARLLTAWWQYEALEVYRRAYALNRERDLAQKYSMDWAMITISREAGKAVLRLLGERPAGEDHAAEKKEIEETLAKLDARPRGPITPVVFPIARPAPLAALLPEGRSASFDLTGDGDVRRWPWPSADTGFLVWAPDAAEPITSGQQLFGARTWWVFWRDGYEPLAMLDDDGDGRLAGAELDGIAVWRDADGDAVSDAGEVVPAADHGIVSIAARATRLEDGVPANDAGIVLRDGSTRPTYDWTPTSVRN